MAAVVSTHPYDQLGLDSPIAEGNGETDRYEAVPAWNELGESPYAESSETEGAWQETPTPGNSGEEGLAWLDVESEKDKLAALAMATAGKNKAESMSLFHDGEDYSGAATAKEASGQLNADPASTMEPPIVIADYPRYGRAMPPTYREKLQPLIAKIIETVNSGGTIRVTINGHADFDAQGRDFETRVSVERASVAQQTLMSMLMAHAELAGITRDKLLAALELSIQGKGTKEPKEPKPLNEEQRKKNRRVEFFWETSSKNGKKKDRPTPPPPPDDCTAWRLVDFGVWTGTSTVHIRGEQVVRFVVKNVNVLSTTIVITNLTHGGKESRTIPPNQTVDIEFAILRPGVTDWTFRVDPLAPSFSVFWQAFSHVPCESREREFEAVESGEDQAGRATCACETWEAGASEFLDDEERDANKTGFETADHEDFEPGNEAEVDGSAALSTPLTAQQRTWILSLDRSALERLPDAAKRDRFLQQDWSDVEFPGNVPRGQSATDEIRRHWVLARSLFDAMAGVTPERRVPTTIRFRDRRAVKVPGQPSQRLFGEACEAFLRLHAAAKAEGVDLVILSSWRSRARQAAASANQPNPAAVARKASAHMYGLAIDLRMGVPGLPVKEINTRVDRATAAKAGTAAKMGNLVRMYRSPVYKWMSLHAREFGWHPYRNEPWHWEYNPPGLKERFEGAPRGELEQEVRADESAASWEQLDETSLETVYEDEGAAPTPLLRTFTAKALDLKVAVYVTQAARRARQVEMMVFAHGLDLCKPVFKDRPATFISERPFKLGELVEATGRPIVLVVPFLDWERLDANRMAFGRKWHRLAQPSSFNQVAAEALEQTRAITGSTAAPTLQRLILAGHSRAYGFFDALAHEHASPQMRTGALASPLHVWALDTTYSAPIADWRAWLRSREDLQATVVYRTGTYRTKDSVVRELGTGVRGKEFAKLAKASNGRMTVMPVAAGKVSHCGIPTAYLPRLLAGLPALTAHGEYEADTQYEEFEEGEDYAGLTTEAEAEAFEPEGEDSHGEWTEQPANEEEFDSPDRFDSFGDERDFEWEAQSSEEEQSQEDSFEEGEQNLSFALDQENESGLAGSGLTTAEQKAVEITSLFETGKRGGFYGLTGNFDGQGLSFGMVNWTMGTGSLQPLLRDFARENPARWIWTFGVDASRFLQLIARKDKAAQKEQHRFAVEQMNSVSTGARGKRIWTVRQPWVGYFKRLSEDTAFQKIQVRYVRNLLAQAEVYCRQFRLTSEQAFCFMFDAVSSHGKWWLKKKFSGVEKRRVMVEEALKSLAARFGEGRVPESEVLLAIADVLGTTSAQRWADKVRTRKRWFVTGMHPRGRELDQLKPRSNVPYSTSKTSSLNEETPFSAGGAGSEDVIRASQSISSPDAAGLLEGEAESRDAMIAAFDADVREGNWREVALRLNGFSVGDVPRMLARMNIEQILNTRSAVTEVLANWPRQAELLAALEAAAKSRKQPRTSRPASSTIWAAYKQVRYGVLERPQVWEVIGGSVGKELASQDSCAARISWSLNNGGIPVRGRVDFINSPHVTFKGKRGDGMGYAVNTSTLASFLTSAWGPPDTVIKTRSDAEKVESDLEPGKIAVIVSPKHAGIIKAGYRADPLWRNDSLGQFKVWKLP